MGRGILVGKGGGKGGDRIDELDAVRERENDHKRAGEYNWKERESKRRRREHWSWNERIILALDTERRRESSEWRNRGERGKEVKCMRIIGSGRNERELQGDIIVFFPSMIYKLSINLSL